MQCFALAVAVARQPVRAVRKPASATSREAADLSTLAGELLARRFRAHRNTAPRRCSPAWTRALQPCLHRTLRDASRHGTH